jgi:hypothetical protein
MRNHQWIEQGHEREELLASGTLEDEHNHHNSRHRQRRHLVDEAMPPTLANFSTGISSTIFSFESSIGHQAVVEPTGDDSTIYFPVWQMTPVHEELVNYNVYGHSSFGQDLQAAVLSQSILFGQVADVSDMHDPFTFLHLLGGGLSHDDNVDEDHDDHEKEDTANHHDDHHEEEEEIEADHFEEEEEEETEDHHHEDETTTNKTDTNTTDTNTTITTITKANEIAIAAEVAGEDHEDETTANTTTTMTTNATNGSAVEEKDHKNQEGRQLLKRHGLQKIETVVQEKENEEEHADHHDENKEEHKRSTQIIMTRTRRNMVRKKQRNMLWESPSVWYSSPSLTILTMVDNWLDF